MFCKNCGKEVNNGAAVCLNCGASVRETQVNDPGGFGYGLLGFCIPIVGLILFLVWNTQKPNSAKAAGIGALVAVVIWILFYIIMFASLSAGLSGY